MRKGEAAIRILAPIAVKQRDDEGEETGEKRIFFRTVPVFDVSQTGPLPGVEPVPLSPPAASIEGDSHQHLIAPLQELAHELGYRVEVRGLPDAGPGGWCDPKRQQIVVAGGPANRQVRTLDPLAEASYSNCRNVSVCGLASGAVRVAAAPAESVVLDPACAVDAKLRP